MKVEALGIRRVGELALAGLVLVVSSGCTGRNPGSPVIVAQANAPVSLEGSSWKLAEIRTPEDPAGIVRPVGGNEYTMTFGEDGRAMLVLNCNRRSGPWAAATDGGFAMGPVVLTRMACPVPTLDNRVAQGLDRAQMYEVRDGRLFLRPMGPGDVLVWDRNP